MSSTDDNLTEPRAIRSLLDTDMYKLTMQAAILQHYPTIEVSYKFYNRNSNHALNLAAYRWLEQEVLLLSDVSITPEEIAFLRRRCPYLPDSYYAFLVDFRLSPQREVSMSFDQNSRALSINIHGLWTQTILYEIPLLSLVSEAYFRYVDMDWSHREQKERAAQKAEQLISSGCAFSEFGTRRRRDYQTQDLVLQGLISAQAGGTGRLMGTSNVHFAHKYDLQPIGTVAHEWFMGTAAITKDYLHANTRALTKWRDTFQNELGIALTDTFGTNIFLQNFEIELARKFAGVRQDSGSPEAFAGRMVQFYQDRGIDPSTKTIVFSDGLTIAKCISLKKLAIELGINCSFGIGTFLTNDFQTLSTQQKSPAMNIVIKLSSANGEPAIKISDEVGKHTGDKDLLIRVQDLLRKSEVSYVN